MRHAYRLLLVVTVLGVINLVPRYREVNASNWNFTKPTEITKIFETIAAVGKFNVAVDPRIKQKLSINLTNVDPVETLYLVAKLANLQVKKVEDIKGRTTYVVASRELIQDQFEKAFSRPIRLKYARADEVAAILGQGLAKGDDLQVQQDARTNSVILLGPEEVLNRVEALIRKLDLPVPQVLIDAKIVTVQTTFTRQLGFVWNLGVNNVANGQVTDQTAGSGPLFAVTEYQRLQPNADLYDSPGPAKGASPFEFGDFFRGNLFFNSAFSALEANGITRTLSSPRLLAINGTQAQLRIGDKIVFSGGPTQPPEERDTGTVMDITPRVNKDNFITMDISVEQSSARFDRGDFPTITQTAAKTTVQVKDGEEVLVGGLVQENSTPNAIKVPFLSDIPVIKHFFTKKNKATTSLELVILLTPQVVKQELPAETGEVAVVPGSIPGTGPSIETPIDIPPGGGGGGYDGKDGKDGAHVDHMRPISPPGGDPMPPIDTPPNPGGSDDPTAGIDEIEIPEITP